MNKQLKELIDNLPHGGAPKIYDLGDLSAIPKDEVMATAQMAAEGLHSRDLVSGKAEYSIQMMTFAKNAQALLDAQQ